MHAGMGELVDFILPLGTMADGALIIWWFSIAGVPVHPPAVVQALCMQAVRMQHACASSTAHDRGKPSNEPLAVKGYRLWYSAPETLSKRELRPCSGEC